MSYLRFRSNSSKIFSNDQSRIKVFCGRIDDNFMSCYPPHGSSTTNKSRLLSRPNRDIISHVTTSDLFSFLDNCSFQLLLVFSCNLVWNTAVCGMIKLEIYLPWLMSWNNLLNNFLVSHSTRVKKWVRAYLEIDFY